MELCLVSSYFSNRFKRNPWKFGKHIWGLIQYKPFCWRQGQLGVSLIAELTGPLLSTRCWNCLFCPPADSPSEGWTTSSPHCWNPSGLFGLVSPSRWLGCPTQKFLISGCKWCLLWCLTAISPASPPPEVVRRVEIGGVALVVAALTRQYLVKGVSTFFFATPASLCWDIYKPWIAGGLSLLTLAITPYHV